MREHWGPRAESVEEILKEIGSKVSTEVVLNEPEVLETQHNRIYFYSDIDRGSVLKLNSTLREKANEYIGNQQQWNTEHPIPLYLHINSYGGSIFHGLSSMDNILACPIPVYTIVDGCCASAATFLSVVGQKRFMQPNAFMLIHQLSSAMWGKYAEFKDEMENLDVLMSKIKSIYSKYTKVPPEMLEEILKRDLWWDAETCLEYGLVDALWEGDLHASGK